MGLDHSGFLVPNLDETTIQLKALGAEFTEEPSILRPEVKITFSRAPENVRIELVDRG